MKQVMSEQVDELIQDPTKARAKATHMTIFQALMEGGGSGSSVPLSRDILIGEGLTIVGAALETTSWILTSAVHQLCLNPLIQRRLHDELVRAFPRGGRDDIYEIELATCEKLPYLTAVIKETHRLTPGIPGRLPRVVPEGDRWLGMTADSLEEKYLVPFGKGSRSCLGMYLASAEIYITLAVLFRRFKFALHKDNEMTGAWVDHFMTTPDGQAALVVSAAEYDD
ncbi:Cytochrome P450 monooxygenase sdnE [Drechslerella dactyloides]|uniref:Cytochrome P450 monooxygenase sdnE n=1 Tax=Drechslerella dactyloides TaxID=74499 RepID=A0AAD6ITR8_DREDA|nr:Cytochrome P450 monooxygenase sdnE [Drechslerella dactyloides]